MWRSSSVSLPPRGMVPLETEEDFMEDRSSDRDLLIALAATSSLSRAAVCRLGAELDRWARGEDPSDLKARAAELALPPTQLSRARALLREARTLAAREKERTERLGAQILTALDPEYPERLRQLSLA